MLLLTMARSLRVLAGLAIAVASTAVAPPAPAAGERTPADTVLTNGKVLTVDARDTVAEALAIQGTKIVAVGTSEALRAWIGPRTEVIDLKGLTVTPGLIDSHCHLASGGADARFTLDLRFPTVRSIADVAGKVRKAAKDIGPGPWIRGSGWDEGKLEERRVLVAADLDAIAPDNPAWLTQTMGHYGVANSLALKLAGIDRNIPDPPGGTIDRDKDGSPTGVLKERAMGLLTRHIPELTKEQRQEAIAGVMKEMNQEGMTAVKDPGIFRETWEAYQAVQARGELTVRVFALWRAGPTVEDARRLIAEVGETTRPYESTGDDQLVSGGIKMAIDGSGGARTAWVYDEWNRDFTGTDHDNRGYPVIDPQVFREQFKLFHDAGLHVGVHSIGDRGIDWTVDTMAEALAAKPTKGLRHSVIHCNVPTEHALGLIARMQKDYDAGYPEAQATFMWWIGDTYAGNFGPERSRRLDPFRGFLKRGIVWGGGSDYPVTPFPVRYGLWASLRRQTLLGVYGADPYGTDEAIDVRTALRSFTAWNARQLFMEGKIGSIEPGKYADLAVWDRDLAAVPADQLKDMRCLLTFLGGRVVYRTEEPPSGKGPASP